MTFLEITRKTQAIKEKIWEAELHQNLKYLYLKRHQKKVKRKEGENIFKSYLVKILYPEYKELLQCNSKRMTQF